MAKRLGLQCLIAYHRMTGITYFGHDLYQRHSRIKRFLLRVWNSLLLVLCMYNLKSLYFQNYLNDMFYLGENLKDDSKRNVLLVLNNIGFVGFYILSLFVCLFMTINGHKMVDHLKNQSLDSVPDAVERRIGRTIALFQFLISFIIESFLCIVILKSVHENCRNGKFFFYLAIEILRFYLPYNGQSAFIALIAYKSYIARYQMKSLEVDPESKDRIKHLYRTAHDLCVSIKSFDRLSTHCIFVIIVMTPISCLSLSTLAIDPKKFFLISCGTALECLPVLSTLCFFCDIIPKTFGEVIEKLNYSSMEFYCEKSSADLNDYHSVIDRIIAFKPDMTFTACGHYSVSMKTLISSIAFIISYAMIIIQTNH